MEKLNGRLAMASGREPNVLAPTGDGSMQNKSSLVRFLVQITTMLPFAFGCATEAAESPRDDDARNASGGASVANPPASTTGGSASSGPRQSLPFALDDYFVPSGVMGDGAMTPGTLTMTPSGPGDSQTCNGARAHDSARGQCHIFTYQEFGDQGWTGVYWQHPANNWGTEPGFGIEPGAGRVRFFARGENGGEIVEFVVGGIGDGSARYGDSFKIDQEVTLTADWQEYSLDISSANYTDGVLGGLAWAMGTDGNQAPATFYIDDITWE
jgi:hypothetical protein